MSIASIPHHERGHNTFRETRRRKRNLSPNRFAVPKGAKEKRNSANSSQIVAKSSPLVAHRCENALGHRARTFYFARDAKREEKFPPNRQVASSKRNGSERREGEKSLSGANVSHVSAHIQLFEMVFLRCEFFHIEVRNETVSRAAKEKKKLAKSLNRVSKTSSKRVQNELSRNRCENVSLSDANIPHVERAHSNFRDGFEMVSRWF